jgi:hypothetical protein
MIEIDENELLSIAKNENCRAYLGEKDSARSPQYWKYIVESSEYIKQSVFPVWRTNRDRTKYIGDFNVPTSEAFPVSFIDLASLTGIFGEIGFDPDHNYLSSSNIIEFHCSQCSVSVVKDGNHRLLQCAFHEISLPITIYRVGSDNWKECKVDMKNFCLCR